MAIEVIYTRTDYMETVDDAYAFSSYSGEREHDDDTVYFNGKDVLKLLLNIRGGADLDAIIMDITKLLL